MHRLNQSCQGRGRSLIYNHLHKRPFTCDVILSRHPFVTSLCSSIDTRRHTFRLYLTSSRSVRLITCDVILSGYLDVTSFCPATDHDMYHGCLEAVEKIFPHTPSKLLVPLEAQKFSVFFPITHSRG